MKIKCAHTKIVEIDKLILLQNPRNNNKHPAEQITRLAKIIKFAGQRKPIVLSNRSGFIIKGHGALLAMAELGWEKCAVDYQDYKTEAEEYQDMTADNEIAKWSIFDSTKFKVDLQGLDLGDFELLGMRSNPFDKDGKTNPLDEWKDMPEFDQEDKTSFRSLIVHFDSQENFDKFAKIVKQKLTDKTKSIWFPEQVKHETEAKRYDSAE